MLHSLLYLESALHVSGGTTNHHQEPKQLYLQHLVFIRPLLLPAASVCVCRQLSWLSHDSCRQPQTYVKPEAAITVFELLMMSGVSLETC